MQEIYSNADRVVVWLGEAGNLSDLALDLIQNAAAVYRKKDGVELNALWLELNNNTMETLKEEGTTQGPAEAWKSLNLLLQRGWWSRVWVVQEVAFSKSCTVLYGSRQLDWQDFTDSFDLVSQAFERNIVRGTSKSLSGLRCFGRVKGFRKIVRSRSAQDFNPANERHFLAILIAFRDLEASDPRDQVYAGSVWSTLSAL
jgi:hypothetical protein